MTAFAQNTRDEVRVQGDGTISGALAAQPGAKQQTYVAECLTPWDVQSKRVFSEDSCGPTLQAGTHEAQNIQPVVMVSAEPIAVDYKQTPKTSDGICHTLTHEGDGGIHSAVVYDQPVVMSSGQANAEIEMGGGCPDADRPARGACTSNGEDVFPALCATDGDKQFIDNQSVRSGRLILDDAEL